MSQTSKIALAVIITSIIVGGGVYLWKTSQEENPEIITETPQSISTTKSILFSDTNNKFDFLADNGCEKYLKVTKLSDNSKTSYNISLPIAKEWNGILMSFELVPQEEYNNILNDKMPGAPRVILNLENKILYTRGLIQVWPEEADLPENCREVSAEKN